MKLGCKVLYIGSQLVPQKGLIVENEQILGQYDQINFESLRELLSIQPEVLKNPNQGSQVSLIVRHYSNPGTHKLTVVIIDTPPNDTFRKILFENLKIPYVVWFDSSSVQEQTNYNKHLIIESYKQMFVISFVQALISKDNVRAAFGEAAEDAGIYLKRSFDAQIDIAQLESLKPEQQSLDNINLTSISSSNGDKEDIFPELGAQTPIRLEDISTPCCPTNISKIFLPFAGRQKELEKICRVLYNSTESFIQVIGKRGCGKTRLVLEAANYIMQRHHPYVDGIYYFSNKKKSEAIVDTIKSTFSSSTEALKSLDVIFKHKHNLIIIDDYDDRAASVLQVLIDQKINTIIVTEDDFQRNSSLQKKLKSPENIEVEPLKKSELFEIIESYTGLNLPQRIPNFDPVSTLGKVFESPKGLIEFLASVSCYFPIVEREEYRIKEVYNYYLDLDKIFEGKLQEKTILPKSSDMVIFSKNSKYFKATLGTKEPETAPEFIKKKTLEFSEPQPIVQKEVIDDDGFDDL